MTYHPDFSAWDNELKENVWYESKGLETAPWRKKRKQWEISGPGRLRVYKGKRRKRNTVKYYDMFLHEEIIPKKE